MISRPEWDEPVLLGHLIQAMNHLATFNRPDGAPFRNWIENLSANQYRKDMDSRDRELLNVIQAAFPVEPHPYRVIGDKLGMDQNEVLARIANLKREGIIRRIGASINSRRIGFVSTLLAAQVHPEKFESFVQTVNSCPGVTHNYERKHAYNVWFTLIASSQAEKERIIRELTEKTGIEILELPATRIFKIRVDFKF